MKKFLFLLVLLSAGLSFAQSNANELLQDYSSKLTFGHYERILHFHSNIKIQKDRSVVITERIVVNARNNNIKRGIFRDIPLSYDYNGGSYHVWFDLIEVKRDGKLEPNFTESMDNGIRIYIGDESRFVPMGVHIYEIKYVVDNVVQFYENHDELFWNVNGNGWDFSIDSLSASLYYPQGAKLLQEKGFTGYKGEKKSDFYIEKGDGVIHFFGTKDFKWKEGMSVAIGWEKNFIEYPTFWEKIMYFLITYALWAVGILGLLIGLTYNFVMWYRYGRDPKPGTIIPRFKAPDGMSPAECAQLKNYSRKTDTLFGSMLIHMAVKGWWKITVSKSGPGKKFTIEDTSDSDSKSELNHIESRFFINFMNGQDSVYFKKGKYSVNLARTNERLTANIKKEQTDKYHKLNSHLKLRQYIFPAITLGVGILCSMKFGGAPLILVGTLILQIVANVIFGRLFEQPTKLGRKKLDEIAGFEMYMKYANKERIKLMNPPTMDFNHFEENLAYAIALGVADRWAGQFEPQVIAEARTHMSPYFMGYTFANFSHFGRIGDEISSTVSSASTPPTPSSSSGGFGGGGFSGGGGGFSGGGFGGGGGGGW